MEIGPLTTREEMIIAGFRETGGGDMTLLIDSILKTRAFFPEGFVYESLLVTDRFFLIANVRAISFGEEYAFQWRCPCTQKAQRSVCKLPSDLKLFKLAEGFHEPFEVKLPKCGSTVGLRLLRISDEKAIDTYRQQMMDRATEPLLGDPGYLFKMARRIATIDGAEVGLEKKLALVTDLLSVDSIKMQKEYEDNESGLSLNIEVKCRNCGQEREITLPFSAEFFRPESPDGGSETAVSAKHFE
ncbi:MAG: hypothetical protein IIA60_05565 [Candidatus Marinimicrobia bacterium]|nr:hypothetical protein [Candidatus Neomarinimicrobiota bacterium]